MLKVFLLYDLQYRDPGSPRGLSIITEALEISTYSSYISINIMSGISMLFFY
jgi:hypothetical protein